MTPEPPARGAGERLYQLALLAYPPAFRRRYGADMVDHFRQRRRELRRLPPVVRGARLAVEIVADLCRSLPREHLARFSDPRPARRPLPPKGDPLVRSLLTDMLHAGRALWQRPAFTLAVVLTLALAIGANAAVFSLVDGILLEPLPYPEPARLVRLFEQNSPTNRWRLSVVDYLAVEEQQRSFTSVAGVAPSRVVVDTDDGPRWERAGIATAGFFDTLGVELAAGRGFRPGEDRAGADDRVVIGHAFKERILGPDVDAVGRAITLDGRPFTVIGVLPPGVRELAGTTAELWPAMKLREPTRRGPFFIRAVARLAEGRTLEEAARDLEAISARIFPLWQESFQDETARLTPYSLREVILGDTGTLVTMVFGAVVLVLLIAVTNVANLMLARASERRGEIAVRAALGASRGRLARLLVAESLLLAAVGGAAGLGLGAWGLGTFVRLGPELPRLSGVGIDTGVVLFTGGISLFSGILFGISPLALGLLGGPTTSLAPGQRGVSTGRRTRRFRAALVVAQFALAVPLLAGAALLLGSLLRLQAVDPGFAGERLVTGAVVLPDSTYPDAASVSGFVARVTERVESVHGVARVAVATGLPPDQPATINNFDLLERPVEPGARQPTAPWLSVTPDFFATTGIPLLRGRGFDHGDDAAAPPVALVSRSWARRFFPEGDALGKRMQSGGCTTCPPITVVGIVGDAKYQGLAGGNEAVYVPLSQGPSRFLHVVARLETAPGAVVGPIQAGISSIDPSLPPVELAPVSDRIRASVAAPRRWGLVVGTFATAALLLAGVGIFGILSYFVSRQARELGIRMALGADSGCVRRLVLGRGLLLAAIGTLMGLGIAVLATRWLESLLFEIEPTDPATLAIVAATMGVGAVAACWLPARRAARIDPAEALASE